MKNCGLSEYVAYSEQAYVDKAVHFAKDLNKLQNLKMQVRNSFVHSPICNYKQFTGELEDKLIDIYKNHKW
jgi:predicted O-linked N-acetylglucosamine transferase (SPINDLY family)